jgi:hypothetical protein
MEGTDDQMRSLRLGIQLGTHGDGGKLPSLSIQGRGDHDLDGGGLAQRQLALA